jgi:membrane-associated phospholipid phosphatase
MVSRLGMVAEWRAKAGAALLAAWMAMLGVPAVRGQQIPTSSAAQASQSPVSSLPEKIVLGLGMEGKRYASDSAAFFTAPIHWNSADWEKAAGIGLTLGGLFAADEHLNHASQANRTAQTNSLSNAVQPMGGAGAIALSAALVAGGFVFHNDNTLDTGRDAIEASIITGLLTNLILKPAFGRARPYQSNGETDFEPLSRNASFPSGDATEAFSVASVVAMHAHGWVIPTLAYTTASLVAYERVNKNVHFPSDVVAGALLGTITGRFLVSRHEDLGDDRPASPSIDVAPTGQGISILIRF